MRARIEQLASGKCVIVVGFSLGAQVALEMMSLCPDLVDDAVINSALVYPQPFASKSLKPLLRFTYPLTKSRTFSKLQARELHIGEADFPRYYEESSSLPLATLMRIMEENMTFAIPDGFQQAKAKVLVTVGKRERRIMKRSAYALVAHHPNSTGIVIPEVGHGIPFANPSLLNELLEGWLSNRTLPENLTVFRSS